jgi:hypothetical protein
MHKPKAQKYLADLDASITGAEAQVREQEERVKKLAAGGHQTENSRETLKSFKALAETMVKHRDLAIVFLARQR